MDALLKRYLPRIDFDSYEDFLTNYRVNVPDDFNFGYDVVDEWARLEPKKEALVWCDDNLELERYTFADAKRLSDKAANFFIANGIKKGDVVLLVLKQRPEVWWAMVALCKIGAICIPGTYQLKKKDIVYRCNAAGIKMIVTVDDDSILTALKAAMPDCKTLKTVAVVGENTGEYINYREQVDKQSETLQKMTDQKTTDPMLIYFSSGTSGMPKMVLHDYSLALGHIVTAKYWQCAQENTVHMTQTDSGWAKFAWGKIYGQWLCGAAVGAFDTEKFEPHSMLSAIVKIHPTTFCAPATIYRYLIKEELSGYDLSFIAHAGVAGEPLNPEVYHQIKTKTGLTIHEGFGQSEGSVLLANFPWFDVKPGSMGKPSPLYNIELRDGDNKPVEDGIVGAICITRTNFAHPTGLFKGYYKDEETTTNCWHDGIYNTGDMAWRDAEGYYWFVGRNDDVIKCSGYRIGPFEVESALLEHPSVLECAVTAAPDPMRGQVVKATIVLAKGFEGSPQLIKELQNHVKRATAPYKYPRIVEFVDELPKTISGKIKRADIRKSDNN